ncbi:hypothetical protein HQ305_13495 [Rhodococcus sp. BP-149]|uniref:hypothetical protein n=1 Tax=unclassified Rhodococcus (in: high G+C Gram-positive bacteria) TaxID=192944 RepID=UPI001C9AF1D5|nr:MULTISPECIES: hypothetical protein [unclassified Rhodococcus (in: high G+C Gram-positive bacteria)]MBY6686572.1 hypothetical protein [Rhodococcus sp. BP-288]MBY6695282.1 hypothetical protein [Rhodococcus sp. BP-188]MBY6700064.1 hypothetical protein [Rhodococcus sp. BP-285]MBY6704913.1 hypothetical protein [Rhodococcus sp. BP-283]MBY6713189.1 hypothetical protein [Rhodococcus sp. BP-160]
MLIDIGLLEKELSKPSAEPGGIRQSQTWRAGEPLNLGNKVDELAVGVVDPHLGSFGIEIRRFGCTAHIQCAILQARADASLPNAFRAKH